MPNKQDVDKVDDEGNAVAICQSQQSNDEWIG